MSKRLVNKLKESFYHKVSIKQPKSLALAKWLKKFKVHLRKKIKIPDRTEHQKKVARAKCGNLYLKNPNIWVLDDESYFTLNHSTNNGNDKLYTSEISATCKY